MTNYIIIFLIGAAILATIAFLIGRRIAPNTPTTTAVDSATVADLARLQERERSLSKQVAELEEKNTRHADQISTLSTDLGNAREKAAADDARVNGLNSALERERSLSEAAQQKLSASLAEVVSAKDKLGAEHTEQAQLLAAAQRLETELRGQITRAGQHITDRDSIIKELRAELQTTNGTISARDSELAAAAERETGLNRAIAERDEQLKGLQQTLKVEFEGIANNILKVTTDQLTEKSKESLAPLLNPLRERIIEFQKKVEDTHLEDTRQRSSLETHIKTIVEANQTIGEQAENLAKALKGDSQLRGRWGEIRLERILESSGLVRDREFVVQGGDFNIKGEDGGSQRPDVVVILPEDRHFVIDSKISLIDYLEYERCDVEEERAGALKKLLHSVKGHIDGLAGKNYQYASAINSHDLVFMFIPIEGVAALVMEHDDQIFEYAWKRKIVMVSPSTLFMAMQTVQSIWRYEHQSENAQAIADQAGQLYDKLASVVGDLNDVSQKIGAAAEAHSEAMKKLSAGKGNALGRAQRLKALGVASKKEIPAIIFGGEKYPVEVDEDDKIRKLGAMAPVPVGSN